MKISISIVVPCYNVEKYLRDCLDSIVSQSYTNFEVVCVNDGSTDNSLNILKEYSMNDPRIKIICQDNKGPSAARNTGIKNSIGKYICFVDSDDMLAPDALEKMYYISENKNLDLLRFEEKFIYDDKKLQKEWKRKVPSITYDLMDGKELFTKLVSIDDMPVYCWKFFIKLENLKMNNFSFPEGLIFEDTITCPVFYFNSKRAYIIREQLYFYRRRTQSITTNLDSIKFVESRFISLLKLSEYPEKYNLSLLQTKMFYEFVKERCVFLFNIIMNDESLLDYLWDYVQRLNSYEAVKLYSMIIQNHFLLEKENKQLRENLFNRLSKMIYKILRKIYLLLKK